LGLSFIWISFWFKISQNVLEIFEIKSCSKFSEIEHFSIVPNNNKNLKIWIMPIGL
jgi:hypothetical protein